MQREQIQHAATTNGWSYAEHVTLPRLAPMPGIVAETLGLKAEDFSAGRRLVMRVSSEAVSVQSVIAADAQDGGASARAALWAEAIEKLGAPAQEEP